MANSDLRKLAWKEEVITRPIGVETKRRNCSTATYPNANDSSEDNDRQDNRSTVQIDHETTVEAQIVPELINSSSSLATHEASVCRHAVACQTCHQHDSQTKETLSNPPPTHSLPRLRKSTVSDWYASHSHLVEQLRGQGWRASRR